MVIHVGYMRKRHPALHCAIKTLVHTTGSGYVSIGSLDYFTVYFLQFEEGFICNGEKAEGTK